jgi:hypothetical protein
MKYEKIVVNNTSNEHYKPFHVKKGMNSNDIERNSLITLLLLINYIILLFLGIDTLFAFIFNPILGFLLLIVSIAFFLLIINVQGYHNTSRFILAFAMLILFSFSIISLNFLGIFIGLFEIYVLVFHQPTDILFKIKKEIDIANLEDLNRYKPGEDPYQRMKENIEFGDPYQRMKENI